MKKLNVGKRSAGLVVAVVLATVATLALVSYVHGVEARATSGPGTASVFVAKAQIPAGTSAEAAIEHAAIARANVPRSLVATDAITALDEITGRVAAVTIQQGEAILASRFVTAGSAASSGLDIPAGHQAMSVEVNTPPGGGGFVAPGSHVSVLAHLTIAQGSSAGPRVQFILQNIQVLGVGQRTLSTSQPATPNSQQVATSTDRTLLTLAVTPSDAEKLAFALFEGDIYFTLLGDDVKPVHTSGRTGPTEFK
jgi:pilus assembly protein CpaB